MAIKDIVAQHQATGSIADEVAADDEGLGQALGPRLLGIGDIDAELATVTQQPLKIGQILGGGDEQDIADARQHEGGQGIVDHRLVIDRHQLFADRMGQRIQPRARTPGEDNAFHIHSLILPGYP